MDFQLGNERFTLPYSGALENGVADKLYKFNTPRVRRPGLIPFTFTYMGRRYTEYLNKNQAAIMRGFLNGH